MAEIRLTEQQRMAVELDGSALLVSAAAGSGKTKVLVERLLRQVTGPEKRNIDEFLIITYTRAAAEELRGRIVRELKKRAAQDPGSAHLRRQSLLVYRTQISTIHGFCAAVLRENAHLLGISSDLRVLDQQDADTLLAQALESLLERRYETSAADGDFRAVVDSLGAGRDDKKLTATVLEAYRKVRSHPDPAGWMERCAGGLGSSVERAQEQLIWEALAKCAYWIRVYDAAFDEMTGDEALTKAYLPAFVSDREWMLRLSDALKKGWDEGRERFPFRAERLGTLRNYPGEQTKERLKLIREKFKEDAAGLADWFDVTEAENMEDGELSAGAVRGLFSLVRELDGEYAELKTRRRGMDYGDLEHFALKLLLKDGEPTDTARQLAGRFREIMVDEYQDTNEVQNLLFNAVSRGGENVFMVGDVKQSIYRFNLADPGIFLEKYRSFSEGAAPSVDGGRRVLLAANFRSRREITDGVNRLFGEIMSRELGELDYGPDEELRPEGTFPPAPGMETELNIVNTGSMASDEEKVSRARGEAAAVARRIRELIDSGFQVTGEDGSMRPVQPGDVVILMRSPGSRTEEYLSALESVGLAGFADGSGRFMDRVEVSVMLSYLEIIDNPHQDVHLIGVLRSPLWNFTPEELAFIRGEDKKCDFYDAMIRRAEKDGHCRDFIDSLDKLRLEAADSRPSELLRKIYAATDAGAVFSALPEGQRRQEALEMLFRHAVAFESRGMNTLFTFLGAIHALQEREKDLPGPAFAGDGGGKVRIMSVHRSKGLEFPVVVLADVMKVFNREDLNRPVLIHSAQGVARRIRDEERGVEYEPVTYKALRRTLEREMLAEEMRILYVAMTRPKDKLIIFAAMENPERTLKKLASRMTLPLDSTFLGAVRSAGDWLLISALMRPECTILRGIAGVDCPVYASGHSPLALRVWEGGVTAEQSGETASPGQSGKTEVLWDGFVYPHETDIPSKITATEIKKLRQGEKTARLHFEKPRFLKKDTALTGAQRGTAIHLAMQYMDYDACRDEEGVKSELERLVREEFITREQADSVEPERILAFFRSGPGRLLGKAEGVHREFKFSLLADAGELIGTGAGEKVLLQGVVDCWLEFPEGIVIIDFKSDAVTPETQHARAEGYADQVRTYAMALERITGRQVMRGILYFFATNSPEIVELS